MSKTAMVRARIEPELKNQAEHVLEEFGISPTQAVNMLYKYIARENTWPFPLNIPNEETRKVLEETDQGIGLVECKDVEDMFNKLGI